ncbi:MAG: HEAT repeat domain-containing protein [Chromatiales bacterium]|nr:HEAT repeat domain-containing protein [Chromatiales bacterium]
MSLPTETTQVLCELLQTGDEADRCYAARTLGALRSKVAIPLLIERLKDEDIDVCVDAAEALGKIGDERTVQALIDSLENESSGEIASIVAESLGKIASADSINALLKALTERPEGLEWDGDWDTWWDVQMEAIKGLGLAKATSAVDALAAFMDDETQQDIENDVLNALIAIGGSGVEKVIGRLQDQARRPQQRRRAARALADSNESSTVQALGQALKDPEPEVRAEAALALANQNAERYLRVLILMLRDPSEEVRDAAVKAVTQLGAKGGSDSNLQETLLPMLSDPSSQVRATLFTMLLPVVANTPLSSDNFALVLESIGDGSAETAAAACQLLGANGNSDATPALLELITNTAGHPMVRREAVHAIGQLNRITDQVMEVLTNVVGDTQQPVRLAALQTLMQLANQGEELREAGADETPRSPLSVVIEAVNGSIRVTEKPNTQKTGSEVAESRIVEFSPNTGKHFAETTVDPDIMESPVPEEIVDTIKLPDNPAPEESQPAEEGIQLPSTPAEIVQEGDVAPAMSTLDAIAMDNVTSMLSITEEKEEPEFDDETQSYLDVVEANKAEMKRIRINRHITPDQDVRRLGAKVLASTDDDSAIETLIQMLSDEDDLIRCEAIEAIGEIARRLEGSNPKLMDAVGTLITQLAVGDLPQKVACARALSYLGHRAAMIPLTEALNDEMINVRIQAVQALAKLSCEGLDPAEADHIVVRDLPPTSVARTLLDCLEDNNIGVRVAAVKGLAQVLPMTGDQTLIRRAIEQIIGSVADFTGEEARQIGRALRPFDTELSNQTLLARLKSAEDSVKRSVFIEMIEEVFNPDQGQAA